MAGQVQCDHPVGTRKERRDVVPPTGVRSAAVDQYHWRLVLGTPNAEVDAAAVDIDLSLLVVLIQCGSEPRRCNRDLARTGKQF